MVARGLPEVRDGALVADQHAGPRARGDLRESPRPFAGRDEVRPEMADGDELVSVPQRGEPAQPAPRDVLQEDPFDRLSRAEVEDLLERWPLDQARHCRGR